MQVLSTMRDESKAISPYTGYWLEIGPANGRLDRGRTGARASHCSSHMCTHVHRALATRMAGARPVLPALIR